MLEYFEDLKSGEKFYFFNTHFDHKGEVARKESAKLILEKIEEISGNSIPVVLCGDFNLEPSSEPIGMISDKLHDSFFHSLQPPHGSVVTFHGFTYDEAPQRRIDYVFVSGDVSVLRYGGLTDSRDRSFFSDHLPILVSLEL